HINNIFREKELQQESVVKDSLTTAADGKKYRTKYFNLDVISRILRCSRRNSVDSIIIMVSDKNAFRH
ncbi:MAG: hypothetical protein IKX24_07915, partial [Prevotella sp.]|nr:hypothetical protein [Prevotella sp.]